MLGLLLWVDLPFQEEPPPGLIPLVPGHRVANPLGKILQWPPQRPVELPQRSGLQSMTLYMAEPIRHMGEQIGRRPARFDDQPGYLQHRYLLAGGDIEYLTVLMRRL